MKKTFLISLAAALLPFVAGGAVVYSTSGSDYVQNFSSLSTSTNTAQTWTDDSTLTGWYTYASATSAAFPTYTPQWQTGISGSVLYHARNTEESVRSFFGARTGSGVGNATIGLQLTNDTGQTLNSFDLSFIASQFYKTVAAQQMQVSFSTDATSLTTGTWTLLPALTYTAPYTTVNAQVSSAEEIASRATLSVSGQAVDWADGSDLWIRFVSYRDLSGSYTGASAVLAINDVSFTAVPEPSTMALMAGFAALGLILLRRRRA